MNDNVKKRRIDIDILKTIGILMVILAHVNPPNIIFQLRNFDVVLLIIVSSYLTIKSSKRSVTFAFSFAKVTGF